ncbi:MAG TPA: phosphotransferase [Patescibacteria group bacterium]|nr:phosphotransferase [Patescibacteria group bacterium]
MTIEQQLEKGFGLENPVCNNLHTPANDVIEVTTPDGHYALKLYNVASRKAKDVQWELDLILHLLKNGAPVVRPVAGRGGYLQNFTIDGQDRATVLFEWAAGEKPKAESSTYVLLGRAAALIHKAADTFTSELPRVKYDATTLIDEQQERMKQPLIESGQWQRVSDLTERLRKIVTNPALDWGVCHMDLTLDNVHRSGDKLTVFDLDSSGESWRAIEPWGIKKLSEDYFQAWLEGYRSVRGFSGNDEKAAAAFGIVGDIRSVVWKLGFARSSRGKPLLQTEELPQVVDAWLEWEKDKISMI